MKLTPAEQAICDKYSAWDENGYVHCHECPLNLTGKPGMVRAWKLHLLCQYRRQVE